MKTELILKKDVVAKQQFGLGSLLGLSMLVIVI